MRREIISLNIMTRNEQIREEYKHRYKEGVKPVTMADLAKKYKVTRQRIHQIINVKYVSDISNNEKNNG